MPSSLIGEGLLRVNLMRGNLASRFSQEMAGLKGVAAAEGGGLGNALAGGLNQMASIGKVALLGIGAGIAGVIGLGAVLALRLEDQGQAAYEMSEKFGLFPGQASAWLAAAGAVGVGNETMSNGFKFMARDLESVNLAMQAGQKPPKALTEAFEQLGVNIFDSHGKLRDMNSILFDVSKAFAAMPDGPEKAGLAVKLFSRSGTDLLPLLNQGVDGINAFMDAGRKSGAVMSDSQVKAAHEAFLAHKKFDQVVTGLTNRLAIGLLPAMTRVFGYITDTAVPGVQHMVAWLGKHKDVVATVAAAIAGPLVIAIGLYTVSMIAAGIATIVATWPILAIIAAIALLSAGVVYAYGHWGWFRDAVNAAGKDLGQFVRWLAKEVPPIWAGFTKDVGDAWAGLQALGNWIADTFGPILKTLGDGLQKAGQFLNAINPFAKHSPALVDQVRDGTKLIAAHYGAMADQIEDHAIRGRLALVAMSGVGPGASASTAMAGGLSIPALAEALRRTLAPPGGAAAGSAAKQEFNFYGDVKPDQGIALGRDIAWELKGSRR